MFVRLHFVEPTTADLLPKKTIVETVNYAAKYLADLNGQTSLIVLKKYLTSECGDVYVSRNNERIKTEVKEMFKKDLIYPVHRMKNGSLPGVTAAFKFRAVKGRARRLSTVEKKMVEKKVVQKKAKSAKNKMK